MAESLPTIETRLRAQYPSLTASVNGIAVPLDATAYNARIAEMAVAERDAQLAAEAATALKDTRRQVRLARARLQQIRDASGTFTNAQRDAAIKDIAQVLDATIGVLIDLALIERSD